MDQTSPPPENGPVNGPEPDRAGTAAPARTVRQLWRGAQVFDGQALHHGLAVLAEGAHLVGLVGAGDDPGAAVVHHLDGGILAPGFLDLQVNGGGGRMLGQGDPSAELSAICATHRRLGATGVLPTLITADPGTTAAVIAAGRAAAVAGLQGFLGLHLEGPHLDPRRKGAHDAALIRPMSDADLAAMTAAARALPTLMVTLAPEAATPAQIAALTAAGVVVSLGHSDCTQAEARAALASGARCVTHLFNAMSPLGHRAPGLAGTALDSDAYAGLIADGIHVAETPARLADRLARGRLFAVSDAMAVAGTTARGFSLNGRRVHRAEGRLTLDDGTLAGADVSLPQALRWLTSAVGLPVAAALAMMTRIPAQVLGLVDRGVLVPGARADLLHLDEDLRLRAVWSGGIRVETDPDA